jgi:hypothetical protein
MRNAMMPRTVSVDPASPASGAARVRQETRIEYTEVEGNNEQAATAHCRGGHEQCELLSCKLQDEDREEREATGLRSIECPRDSMLA